MAAYRLALACQNSSMRSVGGTALTYGIEATARSSLPYILTQLLQRNGMQVNTLTESAARIERNANYSFSCKHLLLMKHIILLQPQLQPAFAVRPLTAAAPPNSKAESGPRQQQGGAEKGGKNALTVDEEEINAITDQIPQRPMGVVEGTSYTVIIIAGIAMAGQHP